MSGGAAGQQQLGAANNTVMNRIAPVTGAGMPASNPFAVTPTARPPTNVQQPTQVQQPVQGTPVMAGIAASKPIPTMAPPVAPLPLPAVVHQSVQGTPVMAGTVAPSRTVQPTNFSYTTEANRALNMPTNQGQVFNQLQQYYAPRGLGYVRPDAPTQQQLRQMANQIASNSSAYQNTAGQFGTLYDNLVSGRVGQNDINSTLAQMQALSRTAADQYGSVNRLFDNPMFNPVQTTAGVPQQRNTMGLTPAQRFTLPKETWNMNPQQLMRWIQRHERNAGRDSFLGNAAWIAGPTLIGGAAATGLTGIPMINAPSFLSTGIHSGLSNAISSGTGMSSGLTSGVRRASGGLINILRNKE